jgi:hypothetical protein
MSGIICYSRVLAQRSLPAKLRFPTSLSAAGIASGSEPKSVAREGTLAGRRRRREGLFPRRCCKNLAQLGGATSIAGGRDPHRFPWPFLRLTIAHQPEHSASSVEAGIFTSEAERCRRISCARTPRALFARDFANRNWVSVNDISWQICSALSSRR